MSDNIVNPFLEDDDDEEEFVASSLAARRRQKEGGRDSHEDSFQLPSLEELGLSPKVDTGLPAIDQRQTKGLQAALQNVTPLGEEFSAVGEEQPLPTLEEIALPAIRDGLFTPTEITVTEDSDGYSPLSSLPADQDYEGSLPAPEEEWNAVDDWGQGEVAPHAETHWNSSEEESYQTSEEGPYESQENPHEDDWGFEDDTLASSENWGFEDEPQGQWEEGAVPTDDELMAEELSEEQSAAFAALLAELDTDEEQETVADEDGWVFEESAVPVELEASNSDWGFDQTAPQVASDDDWGFEAAPANTPNDEADDDWGFEAQGSAAPSPTDEDWGFEADAPAAIAEADDWGFDGALTEDNWDFDSETPAPSDPAQSQVDDDWGFDGAETPKSESDGWGFDQDDDFQSQSMEAPYSPENEPNPWGPPPDEEPQQPEDFRSVLAAIDAEEEDTFGAPLTKESLNDEGGSSKKGKKQKKEKKPGGLKAKIAATAAQVKAELKGGDEAPAPQQAASESSGPGILSKIFFPYTFVTGKLLQGLLALLGFATKIPGIGSKLAPFIGPNKFFRILVNLLPIILIAGFLQWHSSSPLPSPKKLTFPDGGEVVMTKMSYDKDAKEAVVTLKNTGEVIAEVTPTLEVHSTKIGLNPLDIFYAKPNKPCVGSLTTVEIGETLEVRYRCAVNGSPKKYTGSMKW